MAASSICCDKKDDLKGIRKVNEILSGVQTPLLALLENLKQREQNLEITQEHLETYRAQLEPVQEVFTQVQGSVEAQAPVNVLKGNDELDKVDVS